MEPSAKCYAASPPCGILEFRMACSSETTVSFRAELVAPNGNSDSMYAPCTASTRFQLAKKTVRQVVALKGWCGFKTMAPTLQEPKLVIENN